jgi:hypothetical protein
MSDDEKMTLDERYKYLRKMQKRYQKAGKKEKSGLLDEMEEITGLHRKSLLRLMKGEIKRKPRQKQRGKVYGPDVKAVVSVVAESLDWICAERLQPTLLRTAEQLAAHGEVALTEGIKEKLEKMSISTLGRMVSGMQRDRPRLPRRGPERANRLVKEIPTKRIAWNEREPGHFEVDTVHHSGPANTGQYVHSLQMVDVATGWCERVALLGRGYRVTSDGFERIVARLPIPILEVHPDNGSEFMNHHLLRFWQGQAGSIRLTRSRPYQKNDNRFVEQKNATLIRAYLEHERLDTVAQTNLLNELYALMGLYYNLFQPVMRLVEKTSLSDPQAGTFRVKRRFDTARTPLDRLCETAVLTPLAQQTWLALRETLNPRQLRHAIYALLDRLFALPCADPDGPSQDVFLTLFKPPTSMKGADCPSVTLSSEPTIAAR